jgi:hypothetical protein
LGVIADNGRYARYSLKLRLHEKLIETQHHIGTTSRATSESSAIHAELMESYTQSAIGGYEAPDYIVRSHRHSYTSTRTITHKGVCGACITPAWQGKTPFTQRIAGCRIKQPQFGVVVLRYENGVINETPIVKYADSPLSINVGAL